jgi:long-chain acyl-CoA synthetase
MWTLSASDAQRIARDLMWSTLQSLPGVRQRLPARLQAATLELKDPALALDSLHRVELATAGAHWFNTFEVGYSDLFLARSTPHDWASAALQARQQGAKGMVFSTSGSTGERKHIHHQEDMLYAEACVWASLLQGAKRVVVLCPVHHIYGFIFGVLLPHALQVEVIEASHEQLPTLQAGDVVVAVPAQWQWLATQGKPFSPAITGISSTAPLPATVHAQLIALQLNTLYEIYGSTETAGIGYRSMPHAPFTLLANHVKLPDGAIATTQPDGTPCELDVQDGLQWHDARSFSVGPRKDQAVQVGGHNVSPGWVASQLQQHPAVQHCTVRTHGQGAQLRLKAFAVLHDRTQQTVFEAWMHDTLPWYACPVHVSYGPELPRNAMGKLTDWSAETLI